MHSVKIWGTKLSVIDTSFLPISSHSKRMNIIKEEKKGDYTFSQKKKLHSIQNQETKPISEIVKLSIIANPDL